MSSLNINSIINVTSSNTEINCPLSNKPYENAQKVNCKAGHSFSFNKIVDMYGSMQGNECERPGFCVLCGDRVTKYESNTVLQERVNALMNPKAVENKEMSYPFTMAKVNWTLNDGYHYELKGTVVQANHMEEIRLVNQYNHARSFLCEFRYDCAFHSEIFNNFLFSKNITCRYRNSFHPEGMVAYETDDKEMFLKILSILESEVFSEKSSVFEQFKKTIIEKQPVIYYLGDENMVIPAAES